MPTTTRTMFATTRCGLSASHDLRKQNVQWHVLDTTSLRSVHALRSLLCGKLRQTPINEFNRK